MTKLTLDVDALAVESFPIGDGDASLKGTVHARLATHEIYCTHGDTCRTSCGRVGDCTCPPPP